MNMIALLCAAVTLSAAAERPVGKVAFCAAHGVKVWAFGIEPKDRPHDDPFFLARERELSREMVPLCDDDSRLGFHSEAEAHQFTSAYLRWRVGELDKAEAALGEIDAALAAGRPYPESERERGAETIDAEELADGSLVIAGTCPELKPGQGMELRVYDLCGTAAARVYEVKPEGGRYRIVLPASDWAHDARLRPAWAVLRQGRDYNNGGTTWARPDMPMFPEPRLNQHALTGDNFARLVIRTGDRAKRR